MRLLLTQMSADRFGDEVRRVAPEAVLLRMQDDGSVLGPDGPVARDDLRCDVAWGSADLFIEGHPVRQFFGAVAHSPTIRWFQSPGAGTDDPMFAALLARGVRVTTMHTNSLPISEYVLRAVLDHFQEAGAWRAAQAEHAWRTHQWREVHGSRWVVVGLGSIGREVATRARAFGAHVTGVRRRPAGDEPVDRMLTPDALTAALPDADVVVLCAPLTPETAGLVDAAFLARLPERALLVNVGRGGLVDQDALRAALDAGRPGAAVLDVVDPEPLPADSWLWSHPRVVLTPHNSAGGGGRLARAAVVFVDSLARWRRGEALPHELRDA